MDSMKDSVTFARTGIDFGVVNYNGGEALLDCVRSILAQAGGYGRVRVFDNASGDGSAEAVEAAYPGIEVIRSERNLGYAGALNRLLAAATGEIVVLCNMDLEFDMGWSQAVRSAFAASPGAAAVSSLVVEQTQPPVINSLGVRFYGDLHAQNVGSGEPYDSRALQQRADLGFGSYGAVMCFRPGALRGLGFDESYFLFFEETDFFLRFHLSGNRTVFAPDALVRHRRSLSTRRYSPLKLYYGERNRLTTVFKLLPVWYWPISAFWTVRRLLALSAKTRRVEGRRGRGGAGDEHADVARPELPSTAVILRTLLRAWTRAIVRLPGTLGKRRDFFRSVEAGPGEALALLREHRLSTEQLRLR